MSYLPETIEEAWRVYHKHGGNKTNAAEELGMDRGTLRRILQGSQEPKPASGGTDSTDIKAIYAECERLKKQIAEQEKRAAQREEEFAQEIEKVRDGKWSGVKLPSKSKQKTPDVYARLIITDTHGSHVDQDAIAALLGDLDRLDVREVVHLGDALECGGFLAEHHAMGYVAQIDEASYEDDIDATNDLLDRIFAACPKLAAQNVHIIEGNHEQRLERWCVQKAHTARNAGYLQRKIGPEAVLHIADRGIQYYRQGQRHNVGVPGVVQLGKTYFTHSRKTCKHAAAKIVQQYAGCVWYGNTHRADYYPTRMVNVGLVSAWNPGCLCNLQPKWNHDNPNEWTHGYGLQIVDRKSGNFWSLMVPIDEGRSYLQAAAKVLN